MTHWEIIPTPDDVEVAVPNAFVRGSGFFSHLWEGEVNDAERALLRAVALGEDLPEGHEKTARRLIRRLEMLEEAGDGYRFQVPMIGRWVAEFGAYQE